MIWFRMNLEMPNRLRLDGGRRPCVVGDFASLNIFPDSQAQRPHCEAASVEDLGGRLKPSETSGRALIYCDNLLGTHVSLQWLGL